MSAVRHDLGPPVFSGDLAVLAAERVGDIVRLTFPVPDAFRGARAGQFALLSSNRPGAPLLGRPVSVILGEHLQFAFAVVGEGTRVLAASEPGERITVTGPLGHGFGMAAAATLIVCDATHFGTFVALAMERHAAGTPVDIIYVQGEPTLAHLDAPVHASLEPFARGVQTVSLADLPDALAARGPETLAAGARDRVMAIAQIHAARAGWIAEAALQAPMACGLGVCKVCIHPARDGGTFLVCTGPTVPLTEPAFAP